MKRKLWLIFAGVVILVLLSVAAGYYYLIRMPLPQTEGQVSIRGLTDTVEVYRDQWGVPHLYASNERDLLFAQGYVQAQDRLFQMEMNRRLASGRLSEAVGPAALPVDRIMRTFGFFRAAENELKTYGSEDLALLEAFCAGINGYLESRRHRLPVEFRVLGIDPEPWRPEHAIAWAKVMGSLGSKNWQEEIVRAMLAQKLGPEKARDLLGRNQAVTPTIIPKGMNMAVAWPILGSENGSLIGGAGGGASNNWSVQGSRTQTGGPLLANDMHLELLVPSVWYEMHLVGGSLDVIGMTLPGVPYVIAGHNQDVAWGITFAYTDVQDVYYERLDPEKPGRYLHKGQWVEGSLIKETIDVKGQKDPVVHEVWLTNHGPIISSLLGEADRLGYGLSLRWSGHDPGDMGPTLRRLNLARDWPSFKAAAQQWSEPPVNLVYADRAGNIGYLLGSRVPLRPQNSGMGPFPGWTGEHEWLGYLPPDQKPFVLNPPQGYVATANNRVVGAEYPHYLSEDYAPGYRAARIETFLAEKEKLSMEDCRRLQGDFKCIPAKPFVAAISKFQARTDEGQKLMETLRSWDQDLGPGSAGAAVYSVLSYRMMVNTFEDELGDVLERFFGIGMTYFEPMNRFVTQARMVFLNLMSDPESAWFDDHRTPERENLGTVLEKSLGETAAFLKETLGPDPAGWRWGRLHSLVIQHPLGRVKPLDKFFNLGPFEIGGDFSTVWQAAARPGMDFSLRGWTASNRHIYDLKDWDRSVASIVPGQSGQLGSVHYSDQMGLWLKVQHHPLLYTKDKVTAGSRRLSLNPS